MGGAGTVSKDMADSFPGRDGRAAGKLAKKSSCIREVWTSPVGYIKQAARSLTPLPLPCRSRCNRLAALGTLVCIVPFLLTLVADHLC